MLTELRPLFFKPNKDCKTQQRVDLRIIRGYQPEDVMDTINHTMSYSIRLDGYFTSGSPLVLQYDSRQRRDDDMNRLDDILYVMEEE